MQPFRVYILRCSDGSYYVGHTDDLDKRVAEHQSGAFPGHTKSRLPVALVHAIEVATREEALQNELHIKRWTRAKKEALIRGDWKAVTALARGRDRLRPSTTARSQGGTDPRAGLRSGRTDWFVTAPRSRRPR